MESDPLYRFVHQKSDYTLQASFVSNQQIAQDTARDLGEELSHFPHQHRREFIEQVHELYSKSRCMQTIRQQLLSQAYYQHILRSKQMIINILLHFDGKRKIYHYILCIGI